MSLPNLPPPLSWDVPHWVTLLYYAACYAVLFGLRLLQIVVYMVVAAWVLEWMGYL